MSREKNYSHRCCSGNRGNRGLAWWEAQRGKGEPNKINGKMERKRPRQRSFFNHIMYLAATQRVLAFTTVSCTTDTHNKPHHLSSITYAQLHELCIQSFSWCITYRQGSRCVGVVGAVTGRMMEGGSWIWSNTACRGEVRAGMMIYPIELYTLLDQD